MNKWIPFDYDNEHKLKDHYFYLVATTFQEVPKIAKYHNDGEPHFEIMPYDEPNNIYYIGDTGITHFMELPKIPSKEEQRKRNDNI